jgi:hypothetical protein
MKDAPPAMNLRVGVCVGRESRLHAILYREGKLK